MDRSQTWVSTWQDRCEPSYYISNKYWLRGHMLSGQEADKDTPRANHVPAQLLSALLTQHTCREGLFPLLCPTHSSSEFPVASSGWKPASFSSTSTSLIGLGQWFPKVVLFQHTWVGRPLYNFLVTANGDSSGIMGEGRS